MVRIFSKITAPFFMDYGAYIYKNKKMHPVLWIMVRIFTKISTPCFMDCGAYIYKIHCILSDGLWCVYLQKSVYHVLWITVRIFTKISAPCFMDYGAYVSPRYTAMYHHVTTCPYVASVS
jgi:hypothetical protein